MSAVELLSASNEQITRIALCNAVKVLAGGEPITGWRAGRVRVPTHVGDTADISQTEAQDTYVSVVVPCQAGDVFWCVAHGGAGVAVWKSILDVDNVVLDRGGASHNHNGLVEVGNISGAAKMVINSKNDDGDWCLVKLSNRISDMVASTELSYTASQNYAVGSYVIVNNNLYKVTSAIARNGAITPGTNCTATTIMAEIAALA